MSAVDAVNRVEMWAEFVHSEARPDALFDINYPVLTRDISFIREENSSDATFSDR